MRGFCNLDRYASFISQSVMPCPSRRSILNRSFNQVPEADWLSVRKLFQDCESDFLKHVYEDAKYLRLLNKGAVLSERLSERWRLSQSYYGASGHRRCTFAGTF